MSRFFQGTNSWDEVVSTLVHALNDHGAADEGIIPHDNPLSTYPAHEEIGGPLGEAFLGQRVRSREAPASSPLINRGAIDPRTSSTIPRPLTIEPTTFRTNNHVPRPFEIKSLSFQERSEILHDLRLAMSRRHYHDGRQLALPLLMENMSPDDYRNLYISLTSPRYRGKEHLRYLWIKDGVTYSLSRPREASDGFIRMHGSNGLRNENIYAVWRLEYYEQTRIWRYLGAVKVPGRRPLETIKWAQLSRYLSESKPTTFFNDATHLDPDQTCVSQGQHRSQT